MIKVISESSENDFVFKVNALLEQGYKILSSSCGFVNSERYDFCSSYQAILYLESDK